MRFGAPCTAPKQRFVLYVIDAQGRVRDRATGSYDRAKARAGDGWLRPLCSRRQADTFESTCAARGRRLGP